MLKHALKHLRVTAEERGRGFQSEGIQKLLWYGDTLLCPLSIGPEVSRMLNAKTPPSNIQPLTQLDPLEVTGSQNTSTHPSN